MHLYIDKVKMIANSILVAGAFVSPVLLRATVVSFGYKYHNEGA